MIYTVTFNPAIDYVVHTNKLYTGKTNRSVKEEYYWGGKGINVTTVLNNLGIESVALGFVAGFTGRAIEQGLYESGIKTDFITLNEGISRINIKIKSSDETEINSQGPKISQKAIDMLFEKLKGLNQSDILVLAGSIPNTLPSDIYEKIMAELSEKNIQIVVDATKDLLVNVLKYKPFLIKPNDHELGEIFGVEIKNNDDVKLYAKKLKDMGAKNVIVSMAGNGAMLIDELSNVHTIGVPKGEVKNSVGAGDSMVAGFLAGYIEKKDYSYALRMGTAAGSATAFSDGLATREKVYSLLEQL